MAAGDLTSLANALLWLGLPADDGTVARLISATSAQIQTFIGYQIASASYARTFNGNGGTQILLPDRPITAVASVTVDGIPILPASPPNDGFVFDSKFVYLSQYGSWRGHWIQRFTRGAQNVAISYTAGYAATPLDVEQACLDWIKSTHDRLDFSSAVKMLRAGDTQIDFGQAITQLIGQTLLMPPAIASALLPYRRIAT